MRKRRSATLPFMMNRLALASWETILRRSVMMARGTCSAAEYRRMVSEKATAAQLSALALMTGKGRGKKAAAKAVLTPWHSRATANAKRLRRKS
jgi:hypothetical protein